MASKKFYVSADELKKAYDEEGSTVKVAERYGVSKKLVLNYMKKFGIQRNQKRTSSELANQIIELSDFFDCDSKQIAAKLNTSLVQVNKCIKKHNIRIRRYHKGFVIDDKGYKHIFKPGHPNASKKGYVRQHVLVMSGYLGRAIDDENEVVHHKNNRKSDNRIENLQLMTKKEHKQFHLKDSIHKWHP